MLTASFFVSGLGAVGWEYWSSLGDHVGLVFAFALAAFLISAGAGSWRYASGQWETGARCDQEVDAVQW